MATGKGPRKRSARTRTSRTAWPRAVGKVLAHAARIDILRAVKRDGPTSPSEIARKGSESLPRLAYHVRELQAAGLIRRARTRTVRGAIESFYELTDDGRVALRAVDAVLGLAPGA